MELEVLHCNQCTVCHTILQATKVGYVLPLFPSVWEAFPACMFSATTVGPTIKTSPKRCSAYCDIFQWTELPELVTQEADIKLGISSFSSIREETAEEFSS